MSRVHVGSLALLVYLKTYTLFLDNENYKSRGIETSSAPEGTPAS